MYNCTRYILFIVVIFSVAIVSCDKKKDPADAFRKYLHEDSTLEQTAWELYTVQQTPTGLKAYLIFYPRRAIKAPVESELIRLCPDSRLHNFWHDTSLKSIELILIKNLDIKNGKAKRLQQITCNDDFDLYAFEKRTIELKQEPIEDVAQDRTLWYEKIANAINDDEPKRVEYLVKQRPQYLDMRNNRGESLLHICKSAEVARLLLAKGVKVDAKTKWNATPLIYAASHPTMGFASVLIENGADMNFMDDHYNTPLSRAYNKEMAAFLVAHGAKVPKDALVSEAVRGGVEFAQYLVEQGAEINTKNRFGDTPLHYVAKYAVERDVIAYIETASWLILNGAEVNAVNKAGESPFDSAKHASPEMLKFIKAHGGKSTKPNICDAQFDVKKYVSTNPSRERAILFNDLKNQLAQKTPNYLKRENLPDADFSYYPVENNVTLADPIELTRYNYPVQEIDKVKAVCEQYSYMDVDTRGMQSYYPRFSNSLERIPYFEKAWTYLPTSTEESYPNQMNHDRFYYQNGSVRVSARIRDGVESIHKKVFYNEFGAPVLVIELFSPKSELFYCALLEYDKLGFLARAVHFVNNERGVFGISIWQTGMDYDDSRRLYFSHRGNSFLLVEMAHHTLEGSFSWNEDTLCERKYTSSRFSDEMTYYGKYPLAPVLPVPQVVRH
jgi:hypothetical protein